MKKEKHSTLHRPNESCITIPSRQLLFTSKLKHCHFLSTQRSVFLQNSRFHVRSCADCSLLSAHCLDPLKLLIFRIVNCMEREGRQRTNYMHGRSIHGIECQCENAKVIIPLEALESNCFYACCEAKNDDNYANTVESPYLW